MSGSLMTDLKAAYLLGVSVRTMFYGQIIGALIGSAVTVLAFLLFTSGDIPNQQFPLVYSVGFRNLAIAFSHGLDPNTLPFIYAFCGITIVSNLIRDILINYYEKPKVTEYFPIWICIGLAFYLPPSYQLCMLIGGFMRLYWKYVDPNGFEKNYAATSAGMIVASGLVGVITSILGFIPQNVPWVITVYTSGK